MTVQYDSDWQQQLGQIKFDRYIWYETAELLYVCGLTRPLMKLEFISSLCVYYERLAQKNKRVLT